MVGLRCRAALMEKAPLKRAQSKRSANHQTAPNKAKRLDCGRFIAAFALREATTIISTPRPRSKASLKLLLQKSHHGVAVLEHLCFRPQRDEFQRVPLCVAENEPAAGREQLRQVWIVEQLLRK